MKVQSSHEVVTERVKRAQELRAKGLSATQVAKEMGLPATTVHYYFYNRDKVAKALSSEKVVERIKQHGRRGVVSALGSPIMNDKVHHEWFVAGWIASYATTNHLDVAGLLVDVDDVLKGNAHE